MKKIINYFFILLFVFTSIFSLAQTQEPVNLGTAVNSEYEELSPLISGDGTRLFFVRMNHPENRYGKKNSQDIWMSELDSKGNWLEAVRLPDNVNISRYNAVFWANDAGTEIIVKGIYNGSGKIWKERGFSKISQKSSGNWSNPKPVKIKKFEKLNDGNLSAAYFSADENTLVMSFSTVAFGKKSNIYVSKKKRRGFSKPKRIKALSSKYDEHSPALNDEGNTLYFSSNRDGDYNIYASKKDGEALNKWSAPELLNVGVNTSGWESYFRLFNEGRSALFVSDQNSLGHADIFRIDFEEIREEETPDTSKLVFKGVIRDSLGLKLPVTHFRLIVDNVERNYINQSPDSAVFEVTLPRQENYQITALLSGYLVDTVGLQASDKGLNIYDFELTAQKVLEDEPQQKMFRLYGVITEGGPQSTLPDDVAPQISLTSALVDSIYYNPENGHYFVQFSEGSNPELNVSAPGYASFSKIISVGESSEINLNINLIKESSSVIIFGKIINQKTGQLIENAQGMSVVVNDTSVANLVYVPEDKTYQINLEKGGRYTIEPRLKGFFGNSETLDLSAVSEKKIQKDLYLSPVEVGESVKLENIFFKTGSSDLLDESIPELKRVSGFLKENVSITIEIGGHSDSVGNDDYNQKLSEERAKSVARYIILSGVPRERIEFKGYGETVPVASNDTAEGRELNRRVEFKVLKN